jgi:hypothetical protein
LKSVQQNSNPLFASHRGGADCGTTPHRKAERIGWRIEMTNFEKAKAKAASYKSLHPEASREEVIREMGGHFQSQEVRDLPNGKSMFFPAGPAHWVADAVDAALSEQEVQSKLESGW